MPHRPDPVKYAAAKKRLTKNLKRMIRESQELQADIAWWNQNRTEHPPFDLGGDIVFERICKEMLDLILSDKMIPDALMRRMNEQADANAETRRAIRRQNEE